MGRNIKNNKASYRFKVSDAITVTAFFVLFTTSYYQLYTRLDTKLTQYIYEQTHQDLPIIHGLQNTEVEEPVMTTVPTAITIPAVFVNNIPIVPGGIIGDEWLLFDDKAVYLQSSGLLGEGYNTVIYAHSRKGLFKNIKDLNIGDSIHITGDNGELYSYKVYEMETVNLKEVSKLKSTEPNIVTLFTCDGPLDQDRVIVRASLVLE